MAKKASGAKAPKATGKPRGGPKKVPSADGAVGKNHNETRPDDDAMRALFANHASAWDQWKAKLKVVEKIETDVKAALKNDGFKVQQFKIRDALLAGPKSEAKIHAEVKDRLLVAKWIGHPMGSQLDLFEQPDRTPAVDRARDEGKQTAMDHGRASPPYAPGSPQYTQWLEGFHEEQERQVRAGIKPLEDIQTEDAPDPARPIH